MGDSHDQLPPIAFMWDRSAHQGGKSCGHGNNSSSQFFVVRKQLAVVSALVGAGGNLGAVTLGSRHSCNGTNGGLLMRGLVARN